MRAALPVHRASIERQTWSIVLTTQRAAARRNNNVKAKNKSTGRFPSGWAIPPRASRRKDGKTGRAGPGTSVLLRFLPASPGPALSPHFSLLPLLCSMDRESVRNQRHRRRTLRARAIT